jgi:hypothetical protein
VSPPVTTLRLTPELEASLLRLPGVRAVRVVTGPDARPTEVHVLADREKPAKQVVRDVQSLAMAEYDIDIDHRIVSVVQLDDINVAPQTSAPRSRPLIGKIAVQTTGLHAEAAVQLVAADVAVEGHARAPRGPASRARLVARATLDAVSLLGGMDACEVAHATVVHCGGRDVAVCLVQLFGDAGEQVFSGSAVVRTDLDDAIARSVLDALNRRLDS